MIIECDNREFRDWIKMADSIIEDMGVDLSKILISISIKNNAYHISASGWANKGFDTGFIGDCIFIRNDLQFNEFIQTYAHEVGHITQKFGIYEDTKDTITKFIAESIAIKFEKKFLIKFNEKYNTDIPIDTPFESSIYKAASDWGKYLVILKTKSKYKLIKNTISN